MPHPLTRDPRVVRASLLIDRIREAATPDDWEGLVNEFDACDAQTMVSALAVAFELRRLEAHRDRLRREYEMRLLETE